MSARISTLVTMLVATIAVCAATQTAGQSKGTLAWDVGAIPDDAWTPTGHPVRHRLVLPDSLTVEVTTTKRLRDQLSEIGYSPADITYLALSHITTITPAMRTRSQQD
jgi:hypothetical protein